MIDTEMIRRDLLRFRNDPDTWDSRAGDWIGDCLDEIDRLRASIQLALDVMSDEENRDEMSSDAQEWCDEVTAILNKAMGRG